MSLLFELPPEDRPKKRLPRARVAAVPEIQLKPGPIKTVERPALPIGSIDHTFECGDGACGATFHDILQEDGRHWYISCGFCGTSQWVTGIDGHLKPLKEEFIFSDGLFAGHTISEAAKQKHGIEYLSWAAESHKRPAVREACKTYLDHVGTAR